MTEDELFDMFDAVAGNGYIYSLLRFMFEGLSKSKQKEVIAWCRDRMGE